MSRRLISALILIGAVVVLLVVNTGKVEVNLVFTSVSGLKSIVFLAFVAAGVAIGLLLR